MKQTNTSRLKPETNAKKTSRMRKKGEEQVRVSYNGSSPQYIIEQRGKIAKFPSLHGPALFPSTPHIECCAAKVCGIDCTVADVYTEQVHKKAHTHTSSGMMTLRR